MPKLPALVVLLPLVTVAGLAQEELACPECHGTHQLTCTNCGGDWKNARLPKTCTRCKGAAKHTCRNCAGSGQVRCTGCKGRGTVEGRTGIRDNGVFRSPVFGQLPCRLCSGSGKLTCKACSRGGGVECSACKGSGKTYRKGTCPECTEGKVPCPVCELMERLRDSRPVDCPDFFDAFTRAARERYAFGFQNALLSGRDVSYRLTAWYLANHAARGRPGFYRHAFQNQERLISFFRNVQSAASRDLGYYCLDIPFDFARRDDQVVLLIRGLQADFKFNTFRLEDAEQRAKEAIKILVAPTITLLDKEFDGSGIDYYAIAVSYGTENFTDTQTDELRPECCVIMMSAEVAGQFAHGRITLEELVGQSDVYLADRNRAMEGGLTKVRLRL